MGNDNTTNTRLAFRILPHPSHDVMGGGALVVPTVPLPCSGVVSGFVGGTVQYSTMRTIALRVSIFHLLEMKVSVKLIDRTWHLEQVRYTTALYNMRTSSTVL